MCPTASKAAHALLAILVNRLSKSSSAQNSCLHLIGLRQMTVDRDAERVHHPAGELNDELYVRSTNLRQLAVSAGSYRVLPCAMGRLCIGSQPDTRVLLDLAGLVAESHLEALYKMQESPPSTASKLAKGLDKYYLYPDAWEDTLVRRVKYERPGLGLSRDPGSVQSGPSHSLVASARACLQVADMAGSGLKCSKKSRHPDTSWFALHRDSFVLAETGRAGEQNGRKGSARLVTCCP